MMICHFLKAVTDGRGIRGWLSAIWLGTNTSQIILAGVCLTTLANCASTDRSQRIGSLVNLADDTVEKRGVFTASDASDIRAAKAIILPPPTIYAESGKWHAGG